MSTAREHLADAILFGCSRADEHDHIGDYEAEVIASRDAQIIAWLKKKGGEEGTRNKGARMRAATIFRLADKLSRGAVLPTLPSADTTLPALREDNARGSVPNNRVPCDHGYFLLHDSCPGCDAAEETPHEADPVSVYSPWAKTEVRRCRKCGMSPSHSVHAAVSRG